MSLGRSASQDNPYSTHSDTPSHPYLLPVCLPAYLFRLLIQTLDPSRITSKPRPAAKPPHHCSATLIGKIIRIRLALKVLWRDGSSFTADIINPSGWESILRMKKSLLCVCTEPSYMGDNYFSLLWQQGQSGAEKQLGVAVGYNGSSYFPI